MRKVELYEYFILTVEGEHTVDEAYWKRFYR